MKLKADNQKNNQTDECLKPGTVLQDRFCISSVLVNGRGCTTYMAWDDKKNAKAEIVEYLPKRFVIYGDRQSGIKIFGEEMQQQYEEGLQRFLEEVKRLSEIGKCGELVNTYEYFESNHTVYAVKESIEGPDLETMIVESGGRLPWELMVDITKSVGEGLRKLHAAGLYHLMVDPQHIWLSGDGNIKLGWVYDKEEQRKNLSSYDQLSDKGYVAPEFYTKDMTVGAWSDVYSLGMVFYRAVTGDMQDSRDRVDTDVIRSVKKYIPSIPDSIDKVISCATELHLSRRYGTVAEFLDALDRAHNC